MVTTTAQEATPRPGGLVAATRECGAIWLGMFALGVGFGVLVLSYGFPWWFAPTVSLLMFAGSVEFLLVGMLAGGAALAPVALTTFLINSRHLFYGLSFPLGRVRGRVAKGYSVFALCDEAYAVLTSKAPATLSTPRILWTQAGMHAAWATGSLTGALVGGASFLADLEGLDFLMTSLFLALTVDAFLTRPDRLALGLAVASALLALLVAPGSMLLVGLAVYSAMLVLRHRHRAARGGRRG